MFLLPPPPCQQHVFPTSQEAHFVCIFLLLAKGFVWEVFSSFSDWVVVCNQVSQQLVIVLLFVKLLRKGKCGGWRCSKERHSPPPGPGNISICFQGGVGLSWGHLLRTWRTGKIPYVKLPWSDTSLCNYSLVFLIVTKTRLYSQNDALPDVCNAERFESLLHKVLSQHNKHKLHNIFYFRSC
jgi:hypothetical protein